MRNLRTDQSGPGTAPNLLYTPEIPGCLLHGGTMRTTVSGDADAFDARRGAAGHMSMTAEALAGGISQQMPEKFGN